MRRIWHRNESIKAAVFFVVGSSIIFSILVALNMPTAIRYLLAAVWGVFFQQCIVDRWELCHWEREDGEGGA